MIKTKTLIMMIVIGFGLTKMAQADALSIYEIQYTEDPNGNSPLDGQLVNCSGGIVIHKYARGFKRIYLYNDAYYDGWGWYSCKRPYRRR